MPHNFTSSKLTKKIDGHICTHLGVTELTCTLRGLEWQIVGLYWLYVPHQNHKHILWYPEIGKVDEWMIQFYSPFNIIGYIEPGCQ